MNDTPSNSTCIACGETQQGLFCHQCGQRHPEGRLTLTGLFQQLPKRLFNLDRGLLRTFFDLFRRPGSMQRDYIRGVRSPYLNPLTYFLVAAAIQLVGLSLTEGAMRVQLEEQFNGSPLAERIGSRLGDQPSTEFADLYFKVIKQGYTYQALLFMALPFALVLRLVTPHLKPKYNLAECTVFALYTTAHIVLITGLVAPLIGRFSVNLQSFGTLVIYLVYIVAAARGFYDAGRGRVLLPTIALIVSFTFFLLVVLTFFAFLLNQRAGVQLLG